MTPLVGSTCDYRTKVIISTTLAYLCPKNSLNAVRTGKFFGAWQVDPIF
jgi:hypothetical protein